MGYCFNCGAEIHKPVYRTTICPSCGKDAKVCKNCRFYSPGAHWDCHETIPEQVREKDRANFCDYFSLSENSPKKVKNDKDDSPRKAFDDLFS
ncbi:MAG: hypothetical protein ACLFQW_05110 [Spirochaetaceae bacterium]